MVGGHFQRGDTLDLHVADEIEEVAAVGFDRVIGQQGIADPGDQRGGGLVGAAGGVKGTGQEGGDLVGGRGIAVEEVAALRYQGRASRSRRPRRQGGAIIFTGILWIYRGFP
jgi:hypothetical protein